MNQMMNKYEVLYAEVRHLEFPLVVPERVKLQKA